MDPNYKTEILATALEGRRREVTEYQVNIDNYRMALERIGDDPDLEPFKAQIEANLAASIREQKKAQIMLDVIEAQVGAA